MDPTDITDVDGVGIDIDVLITSQGTMTSGSLAERLEETVDADVPTDSDEFYASIGIERSDFVSARRFIVAELDANHRDLDKRLPSRELTGGRTDDYDDERFAAVATPPGRRPGLQWAAMAMTSPALLNSPQRHASEVTSHGTAVAVSADYARRSVAATMDYAISSAVALMGSSSLSTDTKDGFAALVSAADTERPARIEVFAAVDDVEIRVLGRDAADTFYVRGEVALQCVTTGSVEGVACDPSDFIEAGTNVTTPIPIGTGFSKGVQFTHTEMDPGTENHYIVTTRGDLYDALGVAPVMVPDNEDDGTLAAYPVIPEMFDYATRAIEPNAATQCTPATDCAGIDVRTQRIPLENELSEDGDAFENSWRTYLSLARRAADEADLLGRELIDAGLSMDVRAEQALDQLAAECGTDIDIDGLLPTSDIPRSAGPCVAGACDSPYVCNAGECVVDPVGLLLSGSPANDDENLGRLRACLGVDEERFVAMGTKEVCVWRNPSNPNNICDQTAFEGRCPFFPSEYAAATCSEVTFTGVEVVGTEQTLDIFEPGPGGSGGGTADRGSVCDALRTLRNFDASNHDAREGAKVLIEGSRIFAPESVLATARNLEFAEEFGSFTSIRRSGRTWINDGNNIGGPAANTWPCDGAMEEGFPGADCSNNDNGFFCQQNYACGSTGPRGAFSARVLSAFRSLSLFTDDAPRLIQGGTVPNNLGAPVSWHTVSSEHTGLTYEQTVYSDPFAEIWRLAADGSVVGLFSDTVNPSPSINGWVQFYSDFQGRNRVESGAFIFLKDILFSETSDTFRPAPNVGTYGSIRDAFEIVCEAGRGGANDEDAAACGGMPPVESFDDVANYTSYMNCLADGFETAGARLAFLGIPDSAITAIKASSGIGAAPENGGRHGAAIVQLRRTLRELPAIQRSVALQLRQFGEEVSRTSLLLRQLGIRGQISTLRMASTIAEQTARCGSNISFGAIATCANTIVQTGIAIRTAALEGESLEIDQQLQLNDFTMSFNAAVERLKQSIDALRDASERIDGSLVELDSARSSGRRAVARATFSDSESTGRYNRVNTVMRRRMNTLQERYSDARTYAVRMAGLARIALEQRLGSRLEDLESGTADGGLSLVEHPSNWVNTLCMASGIDYGDIRDVRNVDFENYEDSFIGDYVRRLEAVVESYRVDFPFSDGSDTSVISLKDEVFNVRRECEPGERVTRNLLDQSTNLQAGTTVERFGWFANGCDEITVNGEDVVRDCVFAQGIAASDVDPTPIENVAVQRPGHNAFTVFFGYHGDADPAPPVSYGAGDTLRQQVSLNEGSRYRISYHARANPGVAGPSPSSALVLVDSSGSSLGGMAESTAAGGTWMRYWFFVETVGDAADESYFVDISGDGTANPQAIDIAGIMVEDVTALGGSFMAANEPPTVFEDSDSRYALCEDPDGSLFRTNHWVRGCDVRCPVAGTSCAPELKVRECYWESDFSVAMSDIENRTLIHSGGFARGNYNYRADSIGINLVGTGIRDCENAETPSTCYASGSVPYSLYHTGPFAVRNHQGSTAYEAPLFNGRIEHARALTAERYVTNPMSAADRGLVEPYLQRGLRGRPLAGNYTIRIFDEPGIRFDRIEDVQIVLNYRFWTRLD